MIDIETLGINPKSPIISIGACSFCVKSGKIGKKFHLPVKWSFEGYVPDVGTIQWWMRQDDNARLLHLNESALDIRLVLGYFSEFIAKLSTLSSQPEFFWANSPAFDFVILRHAYERCGKRTPWNFWQERCVRTARDHIEDRTPPAAAHNALEDAIAQAKDVILYYKTIKS